ncbi:MAG: aspartate aminotransferase family protein [Myxococcales bacterium]|nr:aspartate aminotransferase family protein [Myxococcales bacterium]
MDQTLASLLSQRRKEKFELHESYLNQQMVRVLKTIGFDRHYVRAHGAYLFDDADERYLDLLSGFGTFALGRNHPVVRSFLREVIESDWPNLVQMDVSALSGLLAEQLVATAPTGLTKVFFTNSGTEAVEAAIKFARASTGRDRILFLEHGFHGLTMGSLSLNGETAFRRGFGSLLPGCRSVPFDDLGALEAALHSRDVAAFVFEPIQGKGVHIPSDGYWLEAQRLCQKHRTLFVADEVQCGLGRTGKMWAVEHWDLEPDMLLTAKGLSGGHVPVGAVLSKSFIYDRVFDRMDRAVVHGSTFGKNNLAMAAGLATLQVLKDEQLVRKAHELGEHLLKTLLPFKEQYEFVKDVRGKGLMLAIEFGEPRSLKLRTAWHLLQKVNRGLFCQLVLVPLLKEYKILAQVAGHEMPVIKLLPPLVISRSDCDWIQRGLNATIADCHRVPGAIWELGTHLASQALSPHRKAKP